MSVSGTVEEAAGWPEAIALILWGIVALSIVVGIYLIVEGLPTWLKNIFGGGSGGGSGTDSDNDGSDTPAGASGSSTAGGFLENIFEAPIQDVEDLMGTSTTAGTN